MARVWNLNNTVLTNEWCNNNYLYYYIIVVWTGEDEDEVLKNAFRTKKPITIPTGTNKYNSTPVACYVLYCFSRVIVREIWMRRWLSGGHRQSVFFMTIRDFLEPFKSGRGKHDKSLRFFHWDSTMALRNNFRILRFYDF